MKLDQYQLQLQFHQFAYRYHHRCLNLPFSNLNLFLEDLSAVMAVTRFQDPFSFLCFGRTKLSLRFRIFCFDSFLII